jgi:hypothetical protein
VLPLTAVSTTERVQVANPFYGFDRPAGSTNPHLPTFRSQEFNNMGLDGNYYYPWVLNFLTSGSIGCAYTSSM